MTDLLIAVAFALITLLWQIADSRHRRRYPAGNQQLSDVAHLGHALGDGCLIYLLGAAAILAVFVVWAG